MTINPTSWTWQGLKHCRQFGEGSSMRSMTRTSTGPVCGSSLSPSWSFRASKNVGPDGSGRKLASGGRAAGVNSIVKSNFPASLVLSNIERSTPVKYGTLNELASVAMGTFRAPSRIWPGAPGEGSPTSVPHVSGKPPAIVVSDDAAVEQGESAGCRCILDPSFPGLSRTNA
jgi:hypothetical protein